MLSCLVRRPSGPTSSFLEAIQVQIGACDRADSWQGLKLLYQASFVWFDFLVSKCLINKNDIIHFNFYISSEYVNTNTRLYITTNTNEFVLESFSGFKLVSEEDTSFEDRSRTNEPVEDGISSPQSCCVGQ